MSGGEHRRALWNTTGLRLEGWPAQVALSIGMAGFLAAMGTISLPLPWTPVPFSMMPFAVLVTGAVQRPGYAASSVVVYLVAGAAGLPVYAERSSGWSQLFGATAGYLWGFIIAAVLVSMYMRRDRPVLPHGWTWGLGAVVGAGVTAGIASIAWMWGTGRGLAHLDQEVTSTWGVTRSSLWVLLFLIAVTTVAALWLLARRRQEATRRVDLFFVLLGAILVIHLLGVTVLFLSTPLGLLPAIILGSVVFLPFDIIKAGLAVAVAIPFLPGDSHD